MVILVLGSEGQLGSAIRERMHEDQRYSWIFLGKYQADVTKKELLFRVVDQIKPHVIINCSALTDVDELEKKSSQAYAVNAQGAGNVGAASARVNAKLIHISTDYVFEGTGIMDAGVRRPYRETDPTNPQTVYGKSKLLGEQLIQQGNSRHVILRTAWLYGGTSCFVSKIILQAQEGKELKVVKDEIGSPTSVAELVNAIEVFVDNDYEGIFHASCLGQTSRYEFARYILEQLKMHNPIYPLLASEMDRAVQRPAYSVLENQRLKELNLYEFSHWKSALKAYLKQYTMQRR